jgi:hypothetical protein
MKKDIFEIDISRHIKPGMTKEQLKQAIADYTDDMDSDGPSFLVGDKVENIDPQCPMKGSQGLVTHIVKADDDVEDDSTADDTSDDDGDSDTEPDDNSDASITYSCTNEGANWKVGHQVTKAAKCLKKV